MTDFKLISNGLLAIYWIMECNKEKNSNHTLIELYNKHFRNDWHGERIMNSGFLMMASYLLFVYPQQSDFNNIDFSMIDISKFKIIHQDRVNSDIKGFCCRLRNSITHARFVINEESHIINFNDHSNIGLDRIEFEIGVVDFGNFIDDFAHTINKQMIERG